MDMLPEVPAGTPGLNNVVVFPLGSDKGLCGAINSGVAKQTRLSIAEEESKGGQVNLMCGGNKSYGALKRLFGDRISSTFEELQMAPFSFTSASVMGARLAATDPGKVCLVSN